MSYSISAYTLGCIYFVLFLHKNIQKSLHSLFLLSFLVMSPHYFPFFSIYFSFFLFLPTYFWCPDVSFDKFSKGILYRVISRMLCAPAIFRSCSNRYRSDTNHESPPSVCQFSHISHLLDRYSYFPTSLLASLNFDQIPFPDKQILRHDCWAKPCLRLFFLINKGQILLHEKAKYDQPAKTKHYG